MNVIVGGWQGQQTREANAATKAKLRKEQALALAREQAVEQRRQKEEALVKIEQLEQELQQATVAESQP